MKTNRLLAMIGFFCFTVGAFAESTGTVQVNASVAGANGGFFRIRYVDRDSGKTVTTNTTTPAAFTRIKKGTTYTIDNIQPSVNGILYAGSPSTGPIPHNGKAFTVTLNYGAAPSGVPPVVPPGNPLHRPNLSVAVNPAGIAHISGVTTPGHACYLQATTSLTPPNWVTIGTVSIKHDGSFTVDDPDASKYSCRFYRTMTCN